MRFGQLVKELDETLGFSEVRMFVNEFYVLEE